MADPADEEQVDDEQPRKNWRRELEDRAKSAEDERDRLRRELAFNKAGLDSLSDKQVKALVATHEGEMTAESLRSTADELGFIPKPTETPEVEEQVEDHSDEVAALAKMSGSSPAPAKTDKTSELRDKLNSFKGSSQAYEKFVLDNADALIEAGLV